MINTFSINNSTLKRYITRLLNYRSVDSKSYKSVRNKLKGNHDFTLSLIGGTDEYRNLNGKQREDYLIELIGNIRRLGDKELRAVSFAARNLIIEPVKMEESVRKVFSELRKRVAASNNPKAKKYYNELVTSFCGGASMTAANVSGVDLKGEPLDNNKIELKVKEAAERSSFSEDITSDKEFISWYINFSKEAHGDNYNDKLTKKIANDLINKYGNDYGAMIGAAKSFLTE